MTTIYATILFILICIFYGASRMKSYKENIYPASAGSVNEHPDSCSQCDIVESESKVVRLPDGTYTNTRKYYRIRINGSCMTFQDINDGEQWLAKKVSQKKSLRSQVAEGDVLFIHLKDTDRYKIRRVKRFVDDDTVDTYSYDKEGNEKPSSKPHRKEVILGKVAYRLETV